MNESKRVWTFGEAMAALVSASHEPAEHAHALNVSIGGAEFNVAVGLARLGHPVTFVSVVGADPWGRRIGRELRAEGVTPLLRTTDRAFTGAYLREHRTGDLVRATYLRAGSAASLMNREDTSRINPSAGDILHLTGLTACLSETTADAWRDTAQRAHHEGAHVSLDVNYRSTVADAAQASVRFNEVAPFVSTVMASTDEVAVVTGKQLSSAPQAAEALLDAVPNATAVIVKDGERGSVHLSPDGTLTRASALEVVVTDLVGAGDAFAAGYLSGTLDDLPVADRLTRGHSCAAFVVSTRGDWEGAPTREDLEHATALTAKEVRR